MNDIDPFDGRDHHLGERMDRAVGGLRAPDVLPQALASGRRQRTRRRIAYGAGGIAAATALVLTVPAVATGWPGRDQGPSGSPVAADPAAPAAPAPASPTSTPTATPPSTDGPANEVCDGVETGWWSKPAAEIEDDLSALLPAGVETGETDDEAVGLWDGNLIAGDDEDFASITLLPRPGVLGPWRTLEEVSRLGPCGGGANEPMQPVKPCDDVKGAVACEEIRTESGDLVGVVSEKLEQTYVDGQAQPTDKSYLEATIAAPGGGHVELYVAEGTRADRPSTVHDPADVPALTMDQVIEIITDPVWTS